MRENSVRERERSCKCLKKKRIHQRGWRRRKKRRIYVVQVYAVKLSWKTKILLLISYIGFILLFI